MSPTNTVGMPLGVPMNTQPASRTAEFSTGIHSMQQDAGGAFRPDSVITPVMRSGNGQSDDTFQRQRLLNAYR